MRIYMSDFIWFIMISVLFVLLGLVFIWLGWQIRKKQRMDLAAIANGSRTGNRNSHADISSYEIQLLTEQKITGSADRFDLLLHIRKAM